MDNKNYKYDAFISYRHCDLDKFVAENLHKTLETYELPKNIKEKLNIKGRTIKRVFRDQDELPLSSNLEDPIVDALNNSKFLIVICSPRLKDSMWCKKEIQTFKKLRGRKNIFCVLIEGEPSDSFPEEVLYDEVVTTDKNGKKKKTKTLVEPLAADVRGINKKEVLKKIKDEKLRLIAPMYNLDYDDLKQRHKLRKMKKMIFVSTVVSICALLFALYSTIMFVKIFNQQKTLKKHQALALADDASRDLTVDKRHDAIESSYNALTKFKGVKMPYTPEAEYELVESLGVYNAGNSYKAMDELKTKGVVDFMKISNDGNYLLSFDESEELVLWDANKLTKINSYDDADGFIFSKWHFVFLGEDKFAYISKPGNVVISKLKDGKNITTIKKNKYSYKSIATDSSGKYLLVNDSNTLFIYDIDTLNKISEINLKDEIAKEMYFSSEGDKVFVATTPSSISFTSKTKMTLYVLDASNLKEINSLVIDSAYLTKILEKGDNIIILSNQSIGTNFYSVLTSYNYKNGEVNWTKTDDDFWGTNIIKSAAKGVNDVALVHSNTIDIINLDNGHLKQSFTIKSECIGIYASTEANIYVAFASDGTVSFLSLDYNEVIINNGLFELNLEKYKDVAKTNNGYLLIPYNDNRIIYYEKNESKDLKKEDLKLDYVSDDSVKLSEYDKIKKDFNIKKKNLVDKMLYDDKKTLLFVSYTDDTLGIYHVKDKSFITYITDVSDIYHYFGKDKDGRIYVGNITDTYIIDEDYNKVGHIKSMVQLDKKKNRVIIKSSDDFYSLPIYSLDDLLKIAKAYLKK